MPETEREVAKTEEPRKVEPNLATMIRFKLWNIPISIHWTFFLLTAFLGGALGAANIYDWHRVLAFMVAALLSVLVHELGHSLTGLRMGAASNRIELHGFGGTSSFPEARFSRMNSILVTVAGPAASILLAGVVYAILVGVSPMLSRDYYPSALLLSFLTIMLWINVFWSVFNLFPILPLDGGRIVQAALGPQRLKLTCIISFIALAFLGVILWALTQSIYNLILVAILATVTWQTMQRSTGR